MKWTKILRGSGLIEWECEHGVGHPDFDSALKLGKNFEDKLIYLIHGCDHCCFRGDFPGKGKRKKRKKRT